MKLVPIWQMANLIMFAVAFAGPWFSVFDGRVNGFSAGRLFWFITFWSLPDLDWNIFADLIVEPSYLLISAVSPIVFVGIVCIGLYWSVSLAKAIFANQCWWRRALLNISLTGSTIGMLVLTIFLSSGNGLSRRCFWGYWLVVGSLGSSVLLEVVNAKVAKRSGNIPKVLAQAERH